MEKISKVLFLDVDGPINPLPNIYRQKPLGTGSSHKIIFPRGTLMNLKHIIRATNATIVVSSSWRKDLPAMENLKKQFNDYDMKVYDTTPILHHAIRGLECKTWLENIYCITGIYPNYAIIDDEICDIVPYHRGHCVQTTSEFGLTYKLANVAISILNKPFTIKDVKGL